MRDDLTTVNFATMPEITNIRAIVFESCWSNRFHQTADYELLHVLDGRFELFYKDGRRFPGTKGDTFLVHANTAHEDIFEFKEDLKILLVHFRWPGQEPLLDSIDNARINRIDPLLRSELRWTFEHMRNDIGGSELDRTIENIRLMTALLLLHKGTHFLPRAPTQINSRHELVLATQEYIRRNYAGHLSLKQIAGHLKISPCYLSRLFKQECCFNLFEYIAELRIEEAKKLLRDGRFSVSEVALMTGFENPNYFARIFRQKIGVSPGKFR